MFTDTPHILVGGGRARGFTLVELLTVLAIIGVLAAILIPVGLRVREASRSATCQSNLRQIGAAFLLYAADNQQRLPRSYNTQTDDMWYHLLTGTGSQSGAGYLGTRALPRCPSVEAGASYGMLNPTLWYPSTHRADTVPRFFTRLLRPSNWPLAMDADGSVVYALSNPIAGASADNRFAARHRDRGNVVMADGHIQQIAYGDTRWREGVLNDGAHISR